MGRWHAQVIYLSSRAVIGPYFCVSVDGVRQWMRGWVVWPKRENLDNSVYQAPTAYDILSPCLSLSLVPCLTS